MKKLKKIRTVPQTKPYKQIIVNVGATLASRLSVQKLGVWKRGVTSNLSLCGYQAFIFELNEYLPKHHKLTEFQIVQLLANEFPDSKMMQRLFKVVSGITKEKTRQDSLQYYRFRYNSGRLFPTRPGRKGPISFKYNAAGERLSFYSPKPFLMKDKEYQLTMSRYGPDIRREQDFNWHVQLCHPVKGASGRKAYKNFDWCI